MSTVAYSNDTSPRAASCTTHVPLAGTFMRTTYGSPAAARRAGLVRAGSSAVAVVLLRDAGGAHAPRASRRAARACKSSGTRDRSRAVRPRIACRSRSVRSGGTARAARRRPGLRPTTDPSSAAPRGSRAPTRAWSAPDRCPRCAARNRRRAFARSSSSPARRRPSRRADRPSATARRASERARAGGRSFTLSDQFAPFAALALDERDDLRQRRARREDLAHAQPLQLCGVVGRDRAAAEEHDVVARPVP